VKNFAISILLLSSCAIGTLPRAIDRAPAGFHSSILEHKETSNGGDPFAPYYAIALHKTWGRGVKSRFGLCGPGKRCTHYVKDILIGLGCISKDKRPGNVSASSSVAPLKKLGFKVTGNLDPCKARIGSVIVYEGPGNGHMEIKTPKGYLSDYLSLEPRTAGVEDKYIVSEEEFRIPKYAHPTDTYCLQTTPPGKEFRKVKAILTPPEGCIKV
jgi:hypothetical protein